MKTQHGFTMVEMMVTIVVIGLLVGVAMPYYQGQMTSTRRATAGACLIELSQFMERVYTGSMDYSKNNNVTTVLPSNNCRKDLTAYYNFTHTAAQTTYTLSAAPIGTQVKDTSCGTLTINEQGVRTAASKSDLATLKACW